MLNLKCHCAFHVLKYMKSVIFFSSIRYFMLHSLILICIFIYLFKQMSIIYSLQHVQRQLWNKIKHLNKIFQQFTWRHSHVTKLQYTRRNNTKHIPGNEGLLNPPAYLIFLYLKMNFIVTFGTCGTLLHSRPTLYMFM
jgi:hypothetical protein